VSASSAFLPSATQQRGHDRDGTNSIENMMGTVRRVCRNVKRWRNAAMALRWTAAGMMEAAKGFRRLKAYKQLPVLRAALAAHQSKYVTQRVEHDADAA
jgi:putative transposase